MSLLTQVQAQYNQLARPKAISHRPDLAHRVHVLSQYSNETVGAELDEYADYAKVYQVYTWVHKAISKIAEAIMPLPVRVVDADDEVKGGHPVSELLAYVNDTMNPAELWNRWTIHMLLGGESFSEFALDSRGRPVEIWPRRPDEIKVRKDKSPERLLYPRVAGYIYGDMADDLIQPENMWHSRFFNPLNPWRGLAPIRAVREGLVIDMFAQAWSKAFLKRGARPDYALIAPSGITATEREEYEFKLIEKFSGQDGWHKPIILEDGITDIKTFSYPPKDIEWLEQRKFARDEVGGIFGVPDEVMGYGRDTYENMDAAHRWFWLLTLIPFIGHRDTGLTHFFTKVRPMLKPGERIATDLSSVGVLQEDIAPKIQSAKELWGMGVPYNTIDEKLGLGIGPVPGGEIGYLPLALLPIGASPVPAPEGGQRHWLIEAAKQVHHSLPAPTKQAVPEYGSPRHEAIWKAFVARLTPHERGMQRLLKREFQRQQNNALAALRERQATAWAEVIKEQQDLPSVYELFNLKDENAAIADAFFPLLLAAYTEFGQNQLDDLAAGVVFDQGAATMNAIRRFSTRFANDINMTTQARMVEELRAILLEAQEGGWSIPEIQGAIHDRISEVFNVRKSDYETERIARTEMNRVANDGALDGMRQSGVVKYKAWLAALDNRTRPSHVEAHFRYQEEPIPLEAMFEVGSCSGPGPGRTGCLEEDIFCRCTVMPVII